MKILRFLFHAAMIETIAIGLICFFVLANPTRHISSFDATSAQPPTLVIEHDNHHSARSDTPDESANAVNSVLTKFRAYVNQHLGLLMHDDQ